MSRRAFTGFSGAQAGADRRNQRLSSPPAAHRILAMSVQPSRNAVEPPRPVRVALIAGTETLRNLGPVVRHLIVGLLEEPMAVTLVCPAGADSEHLPEPLVQTIRYSPSRLAFLRGRSLEAPAEQLQAANVALLHALDVDALEATSLLAKRLDLDYLVSFYCLPSHFHPGQAHCQALLAASEPIRRALLTARAAPQDMVHLVRPGIYQARQATCFIDPRRAVSIVAAGEIDSLRPFQAVLETFAGLRQAQRDCVYFLIGNGRAEADVRRLAERLGLLAELTFVDRTRPGELTGILKAADIFISPAPAGRVDVELLEAMAAGVPVLVAADGLADFVIPDRTALSFPPGDAPELTVKLKALLDDRVAARGLAEAALAHLREHHSPAKMASQVAGIYRAILSRARTEA